MRKIIFFALLLSLLVISSSAQVVGRARLDLPAVLLSNNTGSLTTVNLTVTRGNGIVSVSGPQIIGNTTYQSAVTGAQYAATYLKINFSKYDFYYTITNAGENVSGPSGGTALTLLAISALSNKPLNNNFSVTGTISSNGTVGEIGGVYDKASAVKDAGLTYFLVPQVPNYTDEAELYLLVQGTYNIPLIEIGNITQAYNFAFGKPNIQANKVNISLYTVQNLNNMSQAPFSCSNNCTAAPFAQLTNFTLSNTNQSINQLKSNPNFNNVVAQLHTGLAQFRNMSKRGYLYTGADMSFLMYADSFYFDNYLATKSNGMQVIANIENQCYDQAAPQITNLNYEYVIGGELRQAWGQFTSNITLSNYNSTVETTDDILFLMRPAANAKAWCAASSEMYNISNKLGGTKLVPSPALANISYARIVNASNYGDNIYLQTARGAYAVNNYPLALIDADYAIAISNASQNSPNYSTGQLINMSTLLAKNSTYGIWATQFANQAAAYVYLSQISKNSSTAKSYAESAYSAALLASYMSRDFKLINQNLVPGTGTQRIGSVPQNVQENVGALVAFVKILFLTALALFAVSIIILVCAIFLVFTRKRKIKVKRAGRGRKRK